MFLYIALVVATVHALPAPQTPQQASSAEPKQILYLPERQQYPPEFQYDLSLLAPQYQIPYNFIGDKQPFPRVQPQIVLYHGGAAPGQPFLLQPGTPPGNFLVPQPQPQPQPGPNVILRNNPPRPVFVAGYPKPAHIPPIEKDAEEVPTNPSKIPPLSPKGADKPEKVTSNEVATSEKQATEADVLAAADRNPAFNTNFNTNFNLRPGQRFFILNGQPLFSNYPNQLYPSANPEINLKYSQNAPAPAPTFLPQPSEKNASPYQNLLLRNAPDDVPTHRLGGADLPQAYPENLVLLNQPGAFQDDFFFRNSLPLSLAPTKELKQQIREDVGSFGALQETSDQDNDAVVIDARTQQDQSSNSETDAEVVSAPGKAPEPTVSQAQPGAIALAGPGGVAAAAPRGNAFVGREGVAVSSPQATAVAGPTRDEIEQKTKKQSKRKQ